MVEAAGVELEPFLRASEPAGEILSEAKDLGSRRGRGSIWWRRRESNLSRFCGRLSPQAKS
jgi:hypothetical protein